MQTSFQVSQSTGEPGYYAAAEFFKAPVLEIGLRVGFFPGVSDVVRHRPDQRMANAMININRSKRSACSSWEFSK
ncbi:MAG: hypothetical protein WC856_03145 [Methylococcaceae bacterium]